MNVLFGIFLKTHLKLKIFWLVGATLKCFNVDLSWELGVFET